MSLSSIRRVLTIQNLLFSAALAAASALTGCASGESKTARPLTAEQFAARNGITLDGGPAQGQPVDRAGAVQYDSPERNPVLATPPGPAPKIAGSDENPNPDPRPKEINQAIGEAVSRPYSEQGGEKGGPGAAAGGAAPERIDLTDPTRIRPASAPGGQALDVFFVVMEVNGRPIFSDKILQVLEKPLAVEARKRNRESFKQLAEEYLMRQVQLYKLEELEVASAEKTLDQADRDLAKGLTMQWRMKQITAAGGSIELARRKAVQDGWDFDELVNQQYRVHLVQLYYQKHITPLIQVSAADIRDYYNRNKDAEFSKPGRVKFRLIRIDPTKYASKDEAFAEAEKIRKRAEKEDFAALASDPKINDDTLARDRGGYVREDGWVQIGSYPIEEIEKAVQAVRPGKVTDIIQARNSLYVAKVEGVEEATVLAFEDPQVQDRITQKLRSQRIQVMRERHVRDLEKDAVSVRKPGAMSTLLEIVMQRYSEWAGKTEKRG